MAATFLSNTALPGSLADLTRLAQPTSSADYAALGVFAFGTLGWLLRGKAWDKPDPLYHLWFERPQQGSHARTKATRNIAEKLEESGKQLVIFWGSQSGTAEGFANRLARECHLRFGLEVVAADLSDYDPETIAQIPESKLAIFILSTFGEGDPSDNTAGLWDWVRKNDAPSLLSNLRYMAFGLGNSNYKYYNRVVDVVIEALDKMGAKSLMPVGRANDAEGGTEEDFLAWKDSLFTVFKKDLRLQERDIAYQPTLSVVEDESIERIYLHHGEPQQQRNNARAAAACTPIKALSVRNARKLFTSSTRNCLHMELDLSDQPEMHYKTGDHLAVWPTNPDSEVERLLTVLGLSDRKDVPISIKSLDSAVKVKIPTPTSASALFRYYLEICSPVSRDTVLSLAPFAPTSAVRELLTRLGKDKEAYHTFILQNSVNIGRLLSLAAGPSTVWSSLPLSFIIESIPHTQPRYYSISSSAVVSPRSAAITAIVSTQHLQHESERIFGLTTNYLLALKQSLSHENGPQPHPHGLTYALNGPNDALAGGKVFAHIRKSKFKLPVLASQSIIMVAAGTGIAPFRGFLQERARLKTVGKEIGQMHLFFGCRNADEDYLYKDELAEFQTVLGDALKIVTAFSRQDRNAAGGKMYVQDRVEECGDELCRLLWEESANLYVCGSANMAREVGRRVGAAMRRWKGWEEESELREWSERVKRAGKWMEDVWG